MAKKDIGDETNPEQPGMEKNTPIYDEISLLSTGTEFPQTVFMLMLAHNQQHTIRI